jgi:leader peptidase (prepilin peptidase)/N-methyltransferase
MIVEFNGTKNIFIAEQMPEYIIQIYAFIFGLCIGSFLNVCIYRLPAFKSVISPSSSCPTCNKRIKFYDNIPIISYILLFGRCRYCKSPISLRYVCVELLTGLCALSALMKYGLSIQAFIIFSFISALIVITYIDIDHKIIPNRITLPGIPLCLLASLAFPEISIKDALLGLLLGGGSLFLIAWGYKTITKKVGMGGGDIKLLAMIGAMIGWKGVICTIYIASAIGTIVGIIVMLARRKNMKFAIPFGPFLSIGAITFIFFGELIINWYFMVMN